MLVEDLLLDLLFSSIFPSEPKASSDDDAAVDDRRGDDPREDLRCLLEVEDRRCSIVSSKAPGRVAEPLLLLDLLRFSSFLVSDDLLGDLGL